MATESHSRISSDASRDWASVVFIPWRIPCFPAARDTARSRPFSARARGDSSQWSVSGVLLSACHTAPIGNLGMRTQATRHWGGCSTVDLYCLVAKGVRCVRSARSARVDVSAVPGGEARR